MEQKVKQDVCIGANIRQIRKARGMKQVELVREVQLLGVELTRETLVKIERGVQHIRTSQLTAIKKVLDTDYDSLIEG